MHKKYIFQIFIIFLLFYSSLSVYAQPFRSVKDIESEKLQLIVDYMRALRFDLVVKAVMENEFTNIQNQGVEVPKETQDKLIKTFSNPSVIVAMYAPIYDRHLSKETLRSSVEFIQSSAGRKTMIAELQGVEPELTREEQQLVGEYKKSAAWKSLQEKTPQLSQDAMNISQEIINKILTGQMQLPAK